MTIRHDREKVTLLQTLCRKAIVDLREQMPDATDQDIVAMLLAVLRTPAQTAPIVKEPT